MSFEVGADAYGRFMGRYSEPLAAQFAELAGVAPGQRALDVGCGPGALAAELVRRLGAGSVCAAEPSESFVAAARTRLPEVDVRLAHAEALPFPDGEFDVAMAQLVVQFMADPVKGLGEMARVTRPGGVVAACLWDHNGGRSPLTPLWRAVRDLDPSADPGGRQRGFGEGDLAGFFRQAGLEPAEAGALTSTVVYNAFEEWWTPFTLGIGPAGGYVSRLSEDERGALRERCRELMPQPPFEVSATAWAVRARV